MLAKRHTDPSIVAVDESLTDLAAAAVRPGPVSRLLSRVRARKLDRSLIAGGDPAASHQLAARAATLTSASFRGCLAAALETLAAAPPRGGRSGPRPWRATVGANAGELRALASMLRESRPLYAAGIAAATELVSDGTGPMYRADPAALAHALELARAAMGGSEPPPPGAGPIVFPPSPRPAAPRPSSTAFGHSSRLTRGGWVHGRREGA